MVQVSFDEIAVRYERDSLVQRAACEVLLELLAIDSDEAVLDLGCGTGHLTPSLASHPDRRSLIEIIYYRSLTEPVPCRDP